MQIVPRKKKRLAKRPLAGVRGQAGRDRPIPAALVISGEGGGVRELQGVKRYLLVGLGRGGGSRRRFVDGDQRCST